MKKSFWIGVSFAFIHFSVEVASFYFVFSRLAESPLWWAFALLFDAVAFVPQSILGIITDKYPRFNIGLTGSLLMIAALFVPMDLVALPVLALGNAMIHVSGAQHTLRGTAGRISPNAIFVGGGSFGVITGQLLGAANVPGGVFIPLALMLLSGGLMWLLHRSHPLSDKVAEFDIAADKGVGLIALLAFVVVAVRGYTAYAIPTEWNKTVPQAITLFVFMGTGKMLGGILADRIGFRRVAYLSLLGGLPFLLFGNSVMLLSLVGVALFSMTMPVTVAILASAFRKQPGFAFGITTIGLFFGTVPAFFVRPDTLLAHQIIVVVLTALALPAIIICIRRKK